MLRITPNTSLLGRISVILLAFGLYLLYVMGASQVWSYLTGSPIDLDIVAPGDYLTFFIFACILSPLTEEILYRHAPLQLAKILGEKAIIPTALATSVLFAEAHQHGYFSLIFQGVMGCVFAYVYVKNGYHYWSSVILHSLWNIWCMACPM